ncbi:MAG: carbohydrate-binding domain-containing protein, partial [Clostridia bacterium]|nr:carbohydrate-binding domain-containing protein [Clostridia bacterium]
GEGNINVSGGTVQMAVYSPEGKTGGGRMGPGGHGGWGGQQTVSGADGIHADGTIEISGGVINIDSAYEGLEGNVINISGGYTVVTAVDDAVNATKGASEAAVNVTGGVLDAAVSPNGDTDGIDSNGTYTQTGGLVITRGPNMEMSAAIDAESGVTVTGGTIIVLGYGRIMAGSAMKQIDLSLHSQGTHTVNVGGTEYTFTNNYAYGQTLVASDTSVTGS